MARYEGMEDILQRVRDRLGQPEENTVGTPPEPAVHLTVQPHEQQYLRTLDAVRALFQHAEGLREVLSSEYVATLTQEQQDHLLLILRQALQELWSVEGELLRRAPHD